MKKWKQISACCLAAAIAAGSQPFISLAVSPEFARTQEEWAALRDNVMEYSELADLIHEYNVTVQNNQRDYNENRNKTSEDIAQDYRDAADEIRNNMSDDDSAAAILSNVSLEAQARNLEQLADDNVNDSDITKMGYDQTEATLVSSAQSAMIGYHQNILDLELSKMNRDLLSLTYDSVTARRSAGMATDTDVLTARENLQNAEAAILTAQSQLDNSRQRLCLMLGWSYNGSPEIKEIPAADAARMEAMNPQEDLEKALANNYTLKMNEKRLSNAESNSSKESLQLTIDDNRQKIASSLNTAYNTVLQSKTAYDQAVTALETETKNMEAAEQKMAIGTISRLEYETQKNTYEQARIAVKTADMNLFQAMETYDWNVNGLAAT